MTSLRIKLSDYQLSIKAMMPDVKELVDTGCPGLLFRYKTDRNSGSWYVYWYKSGRRHLRVFASWPTHDIKSARAQVKFELDKEAGLHRDEALSEFKTVGDVLDWYVDRVSNNRSLSVARRRSIRSVVTSRLTPYLSTAPLADLSIQLIDDLWWGKLMATYAPSTLSASLKELKRAFALAAEQKRISANPVSALSLYVLGAPVIRPKAGRLKPYQVEQVIADAAGELSEPVMFCRWLLLYGQRIGEVRQLKWADIDRAGAVLHIRQEISKSRRGYAIPLSDLALSLLMAWRGKQASDGYAGAWLFPGKAGQPMSERNASRLVSAVSRGHWSSHDVRKLFRSRLDEQREPYTLAESMINHSLGKLDQTYILTADAMEAKRAAIIKYHQWLSGNGFKV